MSDVTDDDEAMVDSRVSQSKGYISLLWHELRIILFLTSIAYATVLHLAHGAGRSSVVSKNAVQISPLQDLLDRGHLLATEVLDADAEIMMQIYGRSTLQLKMLVIAETVVPYDDRHLLSIYVQRQLLASDVMSMAQQRALLAMVDMAPAEAVVSSEEIGEMGSLRNSAVLAFFKRHDNNIHFMLIGSERRPRTMYGDVTQRFQIHLSYLIAKL